MHHQTKLLAAIAAISAVLPAQFAISDGNTAFQTGALSATSNLPRGMQLRTDALAFNHGFEQWWHFRLGGDTREFALKNIGPVSQGVTTGNTHIDRDFDDVDGRGVLKARIDVDCYDAGPSSGVVMNRLTLVNVTAAPVTVDLFHYVDIDLTATANDDQAGGSIGSHRITDLSGNSLEVRALGADASEVAAYPALRNRLDDAAADNLTAPAFPFMGDYTGMFQWSARTLQPGEWRTFTVVFAADTIANCPPSVENYGAGSSTTPEIYVETLPVQEVGALRFIDIKLKNAVPNSPVGLLSNYFPVPGVSYLGVLIWVDPIAGVPQFPIGVTSPTGEAFYTYPVLPGPYLCGFPLYHQFFYLDPMEPIAAFTGGLVTQVGKQ
ncbi:MAG: hypothetical protein IPK26_27405 [Planctomycetes bacterium]|nr:hypothetical protein [Planctomycetota bacterium]